MPLYWLALKIEEKALVVIQPGESIEQARMEVALASLGAIYMDGHEIDDKAAAKVPEAMVGRPLSRSEAAKLMDRLR